MGISCRSFNFIFINGRTVDYFFLGDEELVTAFRFIGINGMTVSSPQSAVEAFKMITEGSGAAAAGLNASVSQANNCQVLIMTEETADWLGSLIIDWQLSGRYPLLVEIPGISGRLEGRKTLVDAIREAIGIQV